MSLAADGKDGNGLQLKLRLNFSSCFRESSNKSIFLCKLRLYLPLDVQRKYSEWIKLATTNFQDSHFGNIWM